MQTPEEFAWEVLASDDFVLTPHEVLTDLIRARDAEVRADERAKALVQRLEASVAAWKSEVVKSARRQAVAMAERDEFNGLWRDALADVRKARDERDAVLAERIAWKGKHAALRADVEDARRNPETLTRLLMRLADALDRDDAEVRAEGGDDE